MTLRISILGNGFSGSGAVFDYLAGRSDVSDPLGGDEFQLLHEPGGLNDLRAAAHNFHFIRSDASIENFRGLALRRYGRRPLRSMFRAFRGAQSTTTISLSQVNSFLERICEMQYRGHTLHRIEQQPELAQAVQYIARRINRRIGRRSQHLTRVLVDGATFDEEMALFLEEILQNPESGSPVLVNQAGSYWEPWTSTEPLGPNRRIVVVTRQLADQFADIRRFGEAFPGTAEQYKQWSLISRSRVDDGEWSHPQVMHVPFEEFVTNFHNWKPKLDAFLAIDSTIESTFDPGRSRRNVGIARQYLSPPEVELLAD